MLILLYSDTNYVLDGFRAEYAVYNCPNNCSGRGLCMSHKCYCGGNWGGEDCSVEFCPNSCSGNGQCKGDRCVCNQGYVYIYIYKNVFIYIFTSKSFFFLKVNNHIM